MAWGELVRWNEERGFGFLRQDSPPGEDVFVHRIVLLRAGIAPVIGTALEFEVEDHSGRSRAARVKKLRAWNEPDPGEPEALSGWVAHINTEKRFVFVEREDQPGVRFFCKLNELGRNGVAAEIGTKVQFVIGERGGRRCVVEIAPLSENT
jgi:cold shock CspA family protein